MKKTFETHRTHLSKVVLISIAILFISTTVLYFMGGFTPKEFNELLKIITPINTLYLGVVFKYTIANPTKIVKPDDEVELSDNYVFLSKIAVYGHLIFLIVLICSYGIGRFVTFTEFTLIITIIESIFGLSAGYFMNHLFGSRNLKEN
jgi:hypothetical protein